ncbi:hypothetical protein GCM10011411_22570 [Aurantiacibacter arachoides]|nr:hypothetical protein GCM10011411_22570 [Aurantiacibacter arachoides]
MRSEATLMENHANWRESARLITRFATPTALLVLSVLLAWADGLWRWGLALTIPLLLLALWDFFQRKHTLRRNYPLLARVRWLMEDMRPYLRSFIVEGDLEGRSFNHDERALVYARSKGQLDAHPFGTEPGCGDREFLSRHR